MIRTVWMAGVTLVAATAVLAQTDQVETSQIFAERFVSRSIGDMAERYTPEMASALTEAKAIEIIDGLEKQNGEVMGVGEAWYEDTVQGFRRYRVPIVFRKKTLDMRLAYDSEDRIAGLFLIAHVERPDPADSPGIESDVTVGSPGLSGTLTLPRGAGPFPAAVLIHGSGPSDRNGTVGPNRTLRDIAWGLAERGIATLRYDKRSYAAPGELAAYGEDLTVREEVIDDARAALTLLRACAGVDAGRVYVIGHSLGGNLAPRIASTDPRPAGVVVLAGPTLPLPEKMLEQQTYIFEMDGEISEFEQESLDRLATEVATVREGLDGTGEVTGYHLGAPLGYYRDLEAYSAPDVMAELGLPCLIIQGGRDYQVTINDFALWQEALAGAPQACLRIFESLDHLLREGDGPSGPADYDVAIPVSPEVLDCMAGWILTGACCAE